MSKELTYQIECGPEDVLYTFVYEIEPYSPGGRDEPPSGGTANVYEIRRPDGEKLPHVDPVSLKSLYGIDIDKIEEDIYEWHGRREKDAYDAAMEDRADAERDEPRIVTYQDDPHDD